MSFKLPQKKWKGPMSSTFTHFIIESKKFPAYESSLEGRNSESGIYGKRIASYLSVQLSLFGYHVLPIAEEDWGFMIEIDHEASFPLFVGAGHTPELEENQFVVFISPDQPIIGKLFWKKNISKQLTKLSNTLVGIFEKDEEIKVISQESSKPAK